MGAESFVNQKEPSRALEGQNAAERSSEEIHDLLCAFGRAHNIPFLVIQGVHAYLKKKMLLHPGNKAAQDDRLDATLQFLLDLNKLTGGQDFFKSNAFKYITESKDLGEVFSQILENAKFWIDRFGMDFFSRDPHSPHERKKFFQAPIEGTNCFLSCKGGSGVGTFSVDFAISLGDRDSGRVRGELWRSGIDTELTPAGRVVRIIRTGSAIASQNTGYEEKKAAYSDFKTALKLSPQRALGFLAMYIAYDLKAAEMKMLSLKGARSKNLSLNGSSAVNFDYTRLGQDLGFELSQNPNWLVIPKFAQGGFYEALETSLDNQAEGGLRNYEVAGLHKILEAWKQMARLGCPLTVCAEESAEEIEKNMRVFRNIQGK